MVYIKVWTDFEKAAADLYTSAPNKVRYCVSFKPKTGQLVLKLTDDTTCIMYKSFSSIILNRFEALNVRLLSQIANARPRIRTSATPGPGPSSEGARARTPGVGGPEDDPMLGSGVAGGDKGRDRSGTPGVKGVTEGGASGGSGGGAGKKKKKGKR